MYHLLFLLLFPLQSLLSVQVEHEQPSITITDEDFQQIVQDRLKGISGLHKNREVFEMIPAGDESILNWGQLGISEKSRLLHLQEEMFRQGKITMIVMAGGEATRFGGPKTFVSVSPELGDFLQIKAANINWIGKTFKRDVPLYILSSEKRIEGFKEALAARNYYGMKSEQFKWFVQGTVDTFIPTEAELKATFQGEDLREQLAYINQLWKENPDGIYRFKGEPRKVPAGHFDAIASFIISGRLTEALNQGIEFVSIVNIDNLQAILKNDGMIAYFAERGDDFGFLLAEKNLIFTIKDKATGKIIQPKLCVRFRERVLSFDGVNEYFDQAEDENYRYILNQMKKSVDVYDLKTGLKIKTAKRIKAETGGTLVQLVSENGELTCPILKEGFELPPDFEHAKAPFFNTNTIILRLKSLLSFLDITEEHLNQMDFEERSEIVREKLIKKIKIYFEFKNHVVQGEYPEIGCLYEGKTKINVSQITRILLQAVQLKGAKVGYLFAPRDLIFAPVKEPEDRAAAANKHGNSLKQYTLY